MSALTIGLGLACCVAGAAAHFRGQATGGNGGREGAFGLAALALLLTGMFLTRS